MDYTMTEEDEAAVDAELESLRRKLAAVSFFLFLTNVLSVQRC